MTNPNKNPKQTFKKGDPLTKMECCALFCRELRMSQRSYYNHYRPLLRFRPYGRFNNKMMRIPYEIAMALINKEKGIVDPDGPPESEIQRFVKNVEV